MRRLCDFAAVYNGSLHSGRVKAAGVVGQKRLPQAETMCQGNAGHNGFLTLAAPRMWERARLEIVAEVERDIHVVLHPVFRRPRRVNGPEKLLDQMAVDG